MHPVASSGAESSHYYTHTVKGTMLASIAKDDIILGALSLLLLLSTDVDVVGEDSIGQVEDEVTRELCVGGRV